MAAGSYVVRLALSAVLAAAVAAATMLVRVPIPATGGYLNFGDIMIFASALLFGWFVGGVAGGIGSAVADLIGFPPFAPYTLVIKGLEGFLAGVVRDGKSTRRDLLAWAAGGTAMVLGYFLAEAYPMGLGAAAAAVEVPFNLLQIASGAIVGIPLARTLRGRLPTVLTG